MNMAVFPIGSSYEIDGPICRQIRYYEDQNLITLLGMRATVGCVASLNDMDRLLEIKDYISKVIISLQLRGNSAGA